MLFYLIITILKKLTININSNFRIIIIIIIIVDLESFFPCMHGLDFSPIKRFSMPLGSGHH